MESKWIWPYIAIASTLALLNILFASPLFAVLGFEYSAIMALVLSLMCGLLPFRVPSELRPAGLPDVATILRLLKATLLLSTVPLALSLLSLAWLPNCSVWDGVVFYLEITFPSALCGSAFGLVFAVLLEGRRFGRSAFLTFWLVTLLISLLPGYTNPQLFTYGWQYGFFPGLVWDEAMELTNTYLFSRLEQLSWVLLIFSMLVARNRKSAWLLVVLALGSAGTISIFHDDLGITRPSSAVERSLGSEVMVAKGVKIAYRDGPLWAEDSSKICRDVRWYLYDIRKRFALTDTTQPITIFIYPTVDDLFAQIGTRSASIAKPWLGQVHIAQSNLGSLKHELTHVLLREVGVWPFFASFSTGLTEGAAMSVEPKYDGLYTLDEHAARILQLHFAEGVRSVMAFTGFASNASQKSYVLAGSFSRYLLRQYGPKRFERVYRTLSFEGAYGKPIDTLESEWRRSLTKYMTPLDANDSLRLRYFYDRSSIIVQPCVRRLGKLERRAHEAWKLFDYEKSKANYREAAQTAGGLTPLIGISEVLYQQDSLGASFAVLDTAHTLDATKQKPAIFIRSGDLAFMLGDSSRAAFALEHAMALKLSAASFLSAYIHRTLDTSETQDLFSQYLRVSYRRDDSGKLRRSVLRRLVDSMEQRHNLPNRTIDEVVSGGGLRGEDRSPSGQRCATESERRNGREGTVLRYLKMLHRSYSRLLSNIDWAEIEVESFAMDAPRMQRMEENDSLALYLMRLNLELTHPACLREPFEYRSPNPPVPVLAHWPLGSLADQWCPKRFRNAAAEMRTEIDQQYKFETNIRLAKE